MNSNHVIRVTQVGSEEELRELEESKVWNFLSSLLKEKLNSTNIDVDLYSNKTCLKVELLEADTKYCIVLSRCTSGLWAVGPPIRGCKLVLLHTVKKNGLAEEEYLDTEWEGHRALVRALPQALSLLACCQCVRVELALSTPCWDFS